MTRSQRTAAKLRSFSRLEAWAAEGWDRRQAEIAGAAPTKVEVVRTIEIAASPATVWALIHPAENAPLVNEQTLNGFTMPGTPRGEVGERQCFVVDRGTGSLETVVQEIVELEEGRRAVTVAVPDIGMKTVTTLAGDQNRSLLAVSFQYEVPASVAASVGEYFEKHANVYLERVREVIESGWRPG